MAVPPEFSLQVRVEGSVVVVELFGEVDALTAPELRGCLAAAIETGDGDVAVDCAGLGFIDSSGLREFIEADGRLRSEGREFRLDRVGPALMRLLQIAGLDAYLALCSGDWDDPGATN